MDENKNLSPIHSIAMPSRNRKYENLLQFVLGAIIFAALSYSLIAAAIQAIKRLVGR